MTAAWFVGRSSWRRGWRELLFLGILAGIVGGAVLGALAGARRTATAHERLVSASNTADAFMFTLDNSDAITDWLAHTPSVERYSPAVGVIGRRAPQQDWYALDAPFDSKSFSTPVLDRGRLPDPDRADEVLITLRTARNAGLELGDELTFRAYARSQQDELNSDPWVPPSGPEVKVRVVGVSRDPTDAQLSQTVKIIYGTPAFAERFRTTAASGLIAVWLKDTPGAQADFQRDLAAFSRTPDGRGMAGVETSQATSDAADHAADAVVTGLLIFAIVAGVAGFVTVAQAIRRHLARTSDGNRVMVALGADRRGRVVAQLVGSIPYLVVGTVVAMVVAYAMSPLFPLGSTRSLEPEPGLRTDPVVLALGGLVCLLLLTAVTAAVAWFDSARGHAGARPRSVQLRGGGGGGRTLPATIGARFAMNPSAGRRALQRTALIGIVVSLAGVVGSALFVVSLDEFTSSPRRFGLDYDFTMEMPTDSASTTLRELAADDDLAAVGVAAGGPVAIEGRNVEAYSIESVKGRIQPVLRRGRVPTGDNEIAIGPRLLSQLHKDIGDEVDVATASGSRSLEVVGTVYSPLPESDAFNGEAVLPLRTFDAAAVNPYRQAIARVRPGADRDAVLAKLDAKFPYGISDESNPNAPGPVRNLEQVARLPLALALFFALLGSAAVMHSMFMTATERRHDIAVLRSLGFTRVQTRIVVVGAATSLTVVALLFGVPLGIIAGRVGWSAVASSLFVPPAPIVPALLIALLGIGLLVFANVVALLPARLVTRARPSVVLRAE